MTDMQTLSQISAVQVKLNKVYHELEKIAALAEGVPAERVPHASVMAGAIARFAEGVQSQSDQWNDLRIAVKASPEFDTDPK